MSAAEAVFLVAYTALMLYGLYATLVIFPKWLGRRLFEDESPTPLNHEDAPEGTTLRALEREAIAVGHDKRCEWHLNRARMLKAIPEAQERDAHALERSGDHYEQSRFHAESAQAIRNGEHAKEEA